MPADRRCTPPPPMPGHRRFGAAVRIDAWLEPTLPSDAELDAADAPLNERAAEILDGVLMLAWKRELGTLPSVPVRRGRARS